MFFFFHCITSYLLSPPGLPVRNTHQMYISICLRITVNSSFHLHVGVTHVLRYFKQTCSIFIYLYKVSLNIQVHLKLWSVSS